MTFREKFDSELKWDRKVMLLSLFHLRKKLKHGKKWKMRHTAKYFCKSLAFVSEDLKIAKALHEGLVFTSRKNAIKVIRAIKNGK